MDDPVLEVLLDWLVKQCGCKTVANGPCFWLCADFLFGRNYMQPDFIISMEADAVRVTHRFNGPAVYIGLHDPLLLERLVGFTIIGCMVGQPEEKLCEELKRIYQYILENPEVAYRGTIHKGSRRRIQRLARRLGRKVKLVKISNNWYRCWIGYERNQLALPARSE